MVASSLATVGLYRVLSGGKDTGPPGLSPDCERRIDRHFGRRLSLRYYDDLSSREDASRGVFVAFYRAEVRPFPNEPQTLREYLIRCEISATDGSVLLFEINPHGVPDHYD